jgi:hypothetical protein
MDDFDSPKLIEKPRSNTNYKQCLTEAALILTRSLLLNSHNGANARNA